MSDFDPEEFLRTIVTWKRFNELVRKNLDILAEHLECEYEERDKKPKVRGIIADELISQGRVDENFNEKFKTYAIRYNLVNFDSELSTDQKLERESQERERESQERERESRERQEVREAENRRVELENRVRVELEMVAVEKEKLRIRNEELGKGLSSGGGKQIFNPSQHMKCVPRFDERNLIAYFDHFEKSAEGEKWPPEYWAHMASQGFIGKARLVFNSLNQSDSKDYQKVKQYVLEAYELRPEAYRQRFRNYEKLGYQNFMDYGREKKQLFDQWAKALKMGEVYENLKQAILIEEFKRRLPVDLKTHLEEKTIDSIEELAKVADDYTLTHKTYKKGGGNPRNNDKGNDRNYDKKSQNQSQGQNQDRNPNYYQKPNQNFGQGQNQGQGQNKGRVDHNNCFNCGQPGHFKRFCPNPKKYSQDARQGGQKSSSQGPMLFQGNPMDYRNDYYNWDNGTGQANSNLMAAVTRPHPNLCEVVMCGLPGLKEDQLEAESEFNDRIYPGDQPFVSNGVISLVDGEQKVPVRILRDTGACRTLIHRDVFSKKSWKQVQYGVPWEMVAIQSSKFSTDSVKIELASHFKAGVFEVGIMDKLPMGDVQMILGNDIAGRQVEPRIQMLQCPIDLDDKVDDLYPVCAVTRAMTKDRSEVKVDKVVKSEPEVDLSDTLFAKLDNKIGQDKITREMLIVRQQNDSGLRSMFEEAITWEEAENESSCFFIQDEVLMRKWRPLDSLPEDKWQTKYQIVIPIDYRQIVLELGHAHPMTGHLGIRKTVERVMEHFYWPQVRHDITEFCRTCEICQRVGKVNEVIHPAPLKPIPSLGDPFSEIIMDCVGPLPKTKKGNQYLVTIMDRTTRFPEAIPVRNIQTKNVIMVLERFFTMVGLPRIIQTDNGSNFTSKEFEREMKKFGITHNRSSPYHPESQGALEKFHLVMKNMMKKFCDEYEKDWDVGIHMLIFAARDSVQESLGFSPFELVFGHRVRGPLTVLKEKFLTREGMTVDGEIERGEPLEIGQFSQRLARVCEIAKEYLGEVQCKMKTRFDGKTKVRNFKPGDKVYVLFPFSGSPLQAKFKGPYIVKRKVSDENYIVCTPDRQKDVQKCHVNMMKRAFEKRVDLSPEIVLLSTDDNTVIDLGHDSPDEIVPKLKNSDVLKNLDEKLEHLENSQKNQLKRLLWEFEAIFPDVPSKTDKILHDVDVGDAAPIKQHSYRVNPMKREMIRKEIKYMLDNDIIETSMSAWSSPCLLVPKPDQSNRFVTDFRKVNNITKGDSFPIPRIDSCIENIGNSRFITKCDMLKGYWQVPLTDRAKEISAFVTPDGFYQYKVMPFGMKNSGATFQRLVNSIVNDMDNTDGYVDDLIRYDDTWEKHINGLRHLFQELKNAKLTVNLVKSDFGKATVQYLGHIVGQGQVKPVNAKVEAILQFMPPINRKGIRRFLGMAGYYRKYCQNFADVVCPLTNLLKKDVKFCWTESCQQAFNMVKTMLTSQPVLVMPDYTQPFKLLCDASDLGAGSILMQDQNGVDHPIAYYSRKFSKHQRNYSTIEKECLAMVLSLQHFESYLCPTKHPIQVFTDHNPLVFIHKMKNKNQRILRWSLMLQEHNLQISHISGKENVFADYLSRY